MDTLNLRLNNIDHSNLGRSGQSWSEEDEEMNSHETENGVGAAHALASYHRGSDISNEGDDIASLQEFAKHKMRRRQSVSAEST